MLLVGLASAPGPGSDFHFADFLTTDPGSIHVIFDDAAIAALEPLTNSKMLALVSFFQIRIQISMESTIGTHIVSLHRHYFSSRRSSSGSTVAPPSPSLQTVGALYSQQLPASFQRSAAYSTSHRRAKDRTTRPRAAHRRQRTPTPRASPRAYPRAPSPYVPPHPSTAQSQDRPSRRPRVGLDNHLTLRGLLQMLCDPYTHRLSPDSA